MPVPIRLFLAVLTAIMISGTSAAAAKRTVFPRAFAPSEGLVSPPEMPQRQEICLNGSWRFQPIPLPTGYKPDQGDPPALTPPIVGHWESTPIKIPSPWNVNAFNQGDGGDFRCYPSYPASWDTAQMGWLRRSFSVPEQLGKGKRLILHFQAVAGDAVVLVNGHQVATNFRSVPAVSSRCDGSGSRYGASEPGPGRVCARRRCLTTSRRFGQPPLPCRVVLGSGHCRHLAGCVSGRPARRVMSDDTYVQAACRPRYALDTDVTLRNDTAPAADPASRRRRAALGDTTPKAVRPGCAGAEVASRLPPC